MSPWIRVILEKRTIDSQQIQLLTFRTLSSVLLLFKTFRRTKFRLRLQVKSLLSWTQSIRAQSPKRCFK
jgi:hypothetical protein